MKSKEPTVLETENAFDPEVDEISKLEHFEIYNK